MQYCLHTENSSSYFIQYIPKLKHITHNPLSRILIAQLEHWFSRENYKDKGFWKFKEPCPNQFLYKPGDSWTEELGVSRKQFNSAFDSIAKRYKSKSEFLAQEDPFNGKLYCSYYDRITRKTYFFRNNAFADTQLTGLFEKQKKEGQGTLTTSDEIKKEIFEQILLICEEETHGKITPPIVSDKIIDAIYAVYHDVFKGSLEKIREYFSRVAQNTWLMGQKANSQFKAYFSYLFRKDVIKHVLESQRERPFGNGPLGHSNKQKQTSLKIINTPEKERGQGTSSEKTENQSVYLKNNENLSHKVVHIFLEETENKLPNPKLTPSLEQKIENVCKTYFDNSLEKVREYFASIARSSWLMGEESSSFQANLAYVLKPDVIQRVRNQEFSFDRLTTKAIKQREYNEKIKEKSETLKLKLQNIHSALNQEYDAKLERLLETEDKTAHQRAFAAWLEHNSPGIFEDWLELGWKTPYVENAFMEYLGQTLIKKGRGQYLSEQMERRYPHLAKMFSRFVDYIQSINARLVDSIQGYSWNSYLLDSYLRTYLGQEEEQRV